MSRIGQILIAHPNLPETDPFYRTVIYIYQDNAAGTVGTVLNRPSDFTIRELCEDKDINYNGSNRLLYFGGPVSKTSLVLLHSDEWHSGNTVEAGARLLVSSDDQMLERLALGDYPAYWRMFAGISAWSPQQLDLELSGQFPYRPENSWLIADANDSILFDYDGEKQWKKAVELSCNQMFDRFF